MTRTLRIETLAPPAPLAEVCDLSAFRDDRHRRLLADARDLMLDGHEPDALDVCFEALRLSPDSYEALALAGTLLAMLDDPKAAAVYTREAIRRCPGRPDAYYDLASTLLDLGRPGEALSFLETGIRLLDGRDDELVDFMYSARVEALAVLGRFDEADRALTEGSERTGDAMQLLEAAREILDEHRRRPVLRVV